MRVGMYVDFFVTYRTTQRQIDEFEKAIPENMWKIIYTSYLIGTIFYYPRAGKV